MLPSSTPPPVTPLPVALHSPPQRSLREHMIRDLQLRGLSERTQEAYLHAVRQLAAFYRRRPHQLNEERPHGEKPMRQPAHRPLSAGLHQLRVEIDPPPNRPSGRLFVD